MIRIGSLVKLNARAFGDAEPLWSCSGYLNVPLWSCSGYLNVEESGTMYDGDVAIVVAIQKTVINEYSGLVPEFQNEVRLLLNSGITGWMFDRRLHEIKV